MKLPGSRRLAVLAAAGVACLAAGTIPLVVYGGAKRADATVTVTDIGSTHIVSYRLPTGAQVPTSLAVAPNGSVWFWADSATAVTLYNWDPVTGATFSHVLGTPLGLGLLTGIQGATAVASTGTIWIGANRSLLSFDVATDAIRNLSLPVRSPDPTVQAGRPSELIGLETITGMTANGNGTIAITSTGTSTVEVLHTSSETFSPVSLGTGFEAAGAAYLQNGTLAISEKADSGGQAGRLALEPPTGATKLVTNIIPGPIGVAGTTVLSNGTASQISMSGVITASLGRPSLAQTEATELPVEAGGETVPVGGVAGMEAWQTMGGVAVASPGGQQDLLKLPTYACHPGTFSRMPAATSPSTSSPAQPSQTGTCGEQAIVLASAPTVSGLFFIPTAPSPTVDYVPASALTTDA